MEAEREPGEEHEDGEEEGECGGFPEEVREGGEGAGEGGWRRRGVLGEGGEKARGRGRGRGRGRVRVDRQRVSSRIRHWGRGSCLLPPHESLCSLPPQIYFYDKSLSHQTDIQIIISLVPTLFCAKNRTNFI